MTSKECLELAIKEFEKEQEEDQNNEWLRRAIKGMKVCKQDLEILDILKRKIYMSEVKDLGGTILSQTIGFNLSSNVDKDFEKIKEWLENK